MIISEIISESVQPLTEARMVWKRSGGQVKRAVRCVGGRRHGRVVSTASQCSAPIDMKKRLTLKKTKAKMGKRLARKANRTKRINPASKKLQRLNKR